MTTGAAKAHHNALLWLPRVWQGRPTYAFKLIVHGGAPGPGSCEIL